MTKDNTKITDLGSLKKEAEEWRNKYLRALADYQNLEKRIVNVRNDEQKLAARNILLKILPVLDVLTELAKITEDEHVPVAIKLFQKILEDEQVKKMEVIGKKFDPEEMECVEVAGDGKDDTVTEEISTGYKLFEQILRVAKVKVGKIN